ncbi:MAG: hypothetical protein ABII82_10995 [Verrucomicrobiota bacterium]
MSTLFKTIALLLLAAWLPATLHCSLEAVGFEAECHPAPSAQDAHGCHADACDIVEDGSYAKSVASARVLPPVVTDELGAWLAMIVIRPLEIVGPSIRRDDPPMVTALRCSWSFARRMALPARAPDHAV